MFCEHGIEALGLGLESCSREPKENDTGMNESFWKDRLTEIAVGKDQNSSLFPGDCQDVLIGKARRIVG